MILEATPGASLAPRRIPEAYVRAEIASFPLTGWTAFRQALVELNPGVDGATGTLWRECENRMSEHASGWSVDRLILARDAFWFDDLPAGRRRPTGRPVSMQRYLRNLAQCFLATQPGSTEILETFDVNAVDAATHYRWLIFALPEDLLLATLPVEPPPTRANTESPLLLRRLVDSGVAEIHHHIGAGMSFSLLWASLLARLGDPALSPRELDPPYLPPFETRELTLRWLLATAVARCVLAELLIRRETANSSSAGLQGLLEDLRRSPSWPAHLRLLLQETLCALGDGRDEALPDFYRLHQLYQEVHPLAVTLSSRPPDDLRAVWRTCDPVAARLGIEADNGGERWLVRHGLGYLDGGGDDPLFRRIFWQALRVRCLYYRSVVQRPMTAGLQWFIRFYDRLAWATPPLSAVSAEVSYRVAGQEQPLQALEVRVSPAPTSVGLGEKLLWHVRSWGRMLETAGGSWRGREPELGVIVHFVKERDPNKQWATGVPPAGERKTHAEPRPLDRVRMEGRYGDFYRQEVKKARAMADLLRAVPRLLWLVRGLDMTSDELAIPTWVMVPLYRYVQWEANLAAASPEARQADVAPPPLRLTAHVGEDFRHLMEGLRRIFECIQYLMGRAGGRLGHAVALGQEPRAWAEAAGSVMMTSEERLWDLVFEWRLYSAYRLLSPQLRAVPAAGRPEQLESQIRELSSSIFRRPYEPQVLAELHHVLHQLLCAPVGWLRAEQNPEALDRARLRLDPASVRYHPTIVRLLRDWRLDQSVFERGQRPVDITLDASEIEALSAVQNAVRRGVSARGIVVEVNPSSNLLIGDMLDLRNHPILRLFPPEVVEGAPPPVPIAVGSDDPIIFSTWLMREYSLLRDAALTAGYPERVVHQWLDNIRRMSLDARFTVAWPPAPRVFLAKLRGDLEDYLQLPRSVRPPPGVVASPPGCP